MCQLSNVLGNLVPHLCGFRSIVLPESSSFVIADGSKCSLARSELNRKKVLASASAALVNGDICLLLELVCLMTILDTLFRSIDAEDVLTRRVTVRSRIQCKDA